MERFFQILAVILAGVAAYFLWQGNADRAFAAAVFGSVSFFLSVRFQVKARNDQRERERLEEERRREAEEESEEFEEEFDEDFDENDEAAPPRLNEMPARARFDDVPRPTSGERRAANDEPKI
jgi:hypothetical protein